jgi:methionyl-tRNA synthetase
MRKFYLTTSIPYANAEPHIGFAQEIVAADCLARYWCKHKADTFFLTGIDEHGLKVKKRAEEEDLSPQEFTDKMADEFAHLSKLLNLTNDDFIRTTEKRHMDIAQDMWDRCFEKGDIYKKKYHGLYCIGCEAFYKEEDLDEGKCPIHKTKCEKIEEKNYFFRLSKYQKEVRDLITSKTLRITPKERRREILSLIRQGLEDISISRPKSKLDWGIPVPNDESQVMYVWFDALSNYLNPQEYWPADLHIIGKDILRFHAALWPAMLISADIDPPKAIHVHGFITVDHEKLSKSKGNIIHPKELVDKFGIDGARFILLRALDFREDSDFTWKQAEELYNSELANELGNALQRVIKLAKNNHLKGYQKKIKPSMQPAVQGLYFKECLKRIWNLEIRPLNRKIDKEKPWENKEREREVKKLVSGYLESLAEIAELIEVFMPATSQKIKVQLKTLEAKPLFPKINPKS